MITQTLLKKFNLHSFAVMEPDLMGAYVSGFLFEKNSLNQKGDYTSGDKNAKNGSIHRY